MSTNKRSKRDTAENIYRSCQITGDCPPDVVNKIENKTWADVLLQAFSSIIFLGNLGIGTGKGNIRPVPLPGGRTVPETIAPAPTRPNIPRSTITKQTKPFSVPLDTIGVGSRPVDPIGARPIDVLNPTSPAIVPLNEALPDTVITLGEGTVPDLDVITDTTSINSHPTVFQSADNGVAILNVTPADPPPTRIIFQTETRNPLYSVESSVGHIDPVYDVFVDPLGSGNIVTLGEEIPLEPINPRSEFDVEDIPKTSTPTDSLIRAYNRAREFYRRRVQQIPTRNTNLLGDVSRAIQFGFENPAFEPEVTLEFQQGLDEVAAAPDADFAGIRKISRPVLTETGDRTVRVSRFAQRAGIRTRQGTVIGQDVHFYYDISPINTIELTTFTDSSTTLEPSTMETYLDSTVIGTPSTETNNILDTYAENFNNAQLIFPLLDEDGDIDSFPIATTRIPFKPFVIDIGSGYFISSETPGPGNNIAPNTPVIPYTPDISVFVSSNDYDIHPSLISRRKRKRSDSF